MATKVTLFFDIGTITNDGATHRVGGFTESWIHTKDFPDPSLDKLVDDLMTARTFLLAKQGTIVATRYQKVTPDGKPGKSKINLTSKRGNPNYPTDVPQMAYAFRAHSSGQNMRLVELRGFPDSQVETGEAKLDPVITRCLRGFMKKIQDDGWMFRGIKMDVPTIDIDTVSDEGVVTLKDDFVFAGAGKKMQILRSKKDGTRDDFAGAVVTGISQTNPRLLNVKGWKGGDCTGGKIRNYSHEFFTVAETEEEAVFLRKLGAPFFRYRGRASKRA